MSVELKEEGGGGEVGFEGGKRGDTPYLI